MQQLRAVHFLDTLIVVALVTALVGAQWGSYREAEKAENWKTLERTVRERDSRFDELDPELVLVGNSILEAGVDQKMLQKKTGLRTFCIYMPGSASALWYAFLKYDVLEREKKPEHVLILFRDIVLTFPTYRTDPRYQSMMRYYGEGDPLLEELVLDPPINPLDDFLNDSWFLFRSRYQVRERVEDWARYDLLSAALGVEEKKVRKAVTHTFATRELVPELATQEEEVAGISNEFLPYLDFDAHIDRSFLPSIIDMCEEAGVHLILVRAPSRRDLPEQIAQRGLPEYAEELLPDYIRKLHAYLGQQEVTFIDFEGEPELRLEHFDVGDHMHLKTGRPLFTRLLAKRLAQAGVISEEKKEQLRKQASRD